MAYALPRRKKLQISELTNAGSVTAKRPTRVSLALTGSKERSNPLNLL